jgi:hypothetical protein
LLHVVGRFFSVLIPSSRGPRHWLQFSAVAQGEAARQATSKASEAQMRTSMRTSRKVPRTALKTVREWADHDITSLRQATLAVKRRLWALPARFPRAQSVASEISPMNRHRALWIAVPAVLLLGYYFLLRDRGEPSPEPLPEELVAAWEAADARHNWISQVDPYTSSNRPLHFYVPCFYFPEVEPGVLSELPQPDRPFALKFQRMTDVGLRDLREMAELEHLDISYTKVTAAGIAELAPLHRLRSLDVGGLELTDDDIKNVAKFTSLRWLNLSDTDITDAGVKELTSLARLRVLGLALTKVTADGLKELAALKNLHTLSLDGNNVTPAAFKQIAQLKKLKTLDLQMADYANESLAELQALDNLQSLDISFSDVTDKELDVLAEIETLRELNLTATDVTAGGVSRLRDRLPELHVDQ